MKNLAIYTGTTNTLINGAIVLTALFIAVTLAAVAVDMFSDLSALNRAY